MQTTGNLRENIFGAAELFFIRWVLEHQPRSEGVLHPNLGASCKADMKSCAEQLGMARQALMKAVNNDAACSKV